MAAQQNHDNESDGDGSNGQDTRRTTESFLITSAEPDLDAVYRARRRRYFWMMGIRFPCLIIAVLVYMWTQNGWLAVLIVAISIPLPWVAVLKANDREPRKHGEVPTYHYGDHRTVQPEIAPEPHTPFSDDASHPVIDGAPDDDPEQDAGPDDDQPTAR